MGEAKSGHILLVAGVHRGGTSALCAALEACGARFCGELLPAMSGVNEAGFWESAEVVDINERLLHANGAHWYSVPAGLDPAAFAPSRHEELSRQAAACLQMGAEHGDLRAFKDPRFCLTLPFWLQVCEDVGLPCSVCAVWRDPLEVARSLEHRDGFPPGFGLRLQGEYLDALLKSLPAGSVIVSYAELVQDQAKALAPLAARLPLNLDAPALRSAVRPDLRHQRNEGDVLPLLNEHGEFDLQSYRVEVERRYPIAVTLKECVERIVARGRELTRIGEAHTHALETIGRKDTDIAGLAGEHRHALATLSERDAQIAQLGEALQDRELQLEKLRTAPALGLLVRAFLKYAKR